MVTVSIYFLHVNIHLFQYYFQFIGIAVATIHLCIPYPYYPYVVLLYEFHRQKKEKKNVASACKQPINYLINLNKFSITLTKIGKYNNFNFLDYDLQIRAAVAAAENNCYKILYKSLVFDRLNYQQCKINNMTMRKLAFIQY